MEISSVSIICNFIFLFFTFIFNFSYKNCQIKVQDVCILFIFNYYHVIHLHKSDVLNSVVDSEGFA